VCGVTGLKTANALSVIRRVDSRSQVALLHPYPCALSHVMVPKDLFACATRPINPIKKQQKHQMVKAAEAAPAGRRESSLIRSPARTKLMYVFGKVELQTESGASQ
jgi:hypothetical protein